MSPSNSHLLNYQQCSGRYVRTACGSRFLVVGHEDLAMVFRSGGGMVNIALPGVDHVPDLSHHLFSLRIMADLGHEYRGNK